MILIKACFYGIMNMSRKLAQNRKGYVRLSESDVIPYMDCN